LAVVVSQDYLEVIELGPAILLVFLPFGVGVLMLQAVGCMGRRELLERMPLCFFGRAVLLAQAQD
jgi:hypothetical protein